MSYEEIAAAMKLTVPAVKSLLFRARDHLRAAQAQQPFPVHPQRGGSRDDAVEPFGRRGAGCVRVGGHRAGSAAEKTPETVHEDLGELVD